MATPSWVGRLRGSWSREAHFKRACTKYLGPILPTTYEQVRAWMRGRLNLRIGFDTLIRVAKGTSYVHAYEVIRGGRPVLTLGTPQIED